MGTLLHVGLLLVLASAPTPAPQGDSARLPIEELLERARARRAADQARLQPMVSAALQGFAAGATRATAAQHAALVEQLVALGPPAAPLLVEHLDPAPSEEAVDRARARAVAEALARLPGPALTDPLLGVLRAGSPEGQRNALRALETSPESARVRPALRAVFDAAPAGDLKQAALRALIRLQSPENAQLLAQVLFQDDPELVSLALAALIDTRDTLAAPQVRALLADPARAQRHARLLLRYYGALPALVDVEVLKLWVGVAASPAALDTRVLVLQALPGLAGSSASDVRRSLQPLVTDATDPKLREALLVALVRMGDRNARRELLAGYDDFVDRNDGFADAYIRRAAVYMQIEDWDDAIKDYQQAMRLARNDAGPKPEAFLGLARAYACRGKLRDAAEWLRKAPISIKELRELADDPDFAELRASRYSKDAFGF